MMMKPTFPSPKPCRASVETAVTIRRDLTFARETRTPTTIIAGVEAAVFSRRVKPKRDKAAALVIVLAFVVLLTGLVVAYLSRATMDRQMAQASFRDADADILARGALEIVVGDFKQEIVNGSTNFQYTNQAGQLTHFYTPTSNANVLPMRSGNPAIPNPLDETTDPIPNLIRRSVTNDSIAPPG